MYRAFFAFIRNPLINSRGEDTSAAFGFVNTLLSLVREHRPEYLAIVFDTGRPTFRHEMYEPYKATRQKMPEQMISQVPRVREAVDALGLPRLEMEGFEADDVIGTLAMRAAEAGFEVVMVTGDKDFMQLVGPRISMFVPIKNEVVRPDTIRDKYGIEPERVVDFLALMGDSSDNIPGVPKVGEKTALELLHRFGTLDAVLEHADDIPKPSIRAGVKENREQALLSRKLATIRTDVPVNADLESFRFDGYHTDTAIEFFRKMEFNKLADALQGQAENEKPVIDARVISSDEVDALFKELSGAGEIALDILADGDEPMLADIAGISLAADGEPRYLPFGHAEGENLDTATVIPKLRALLAGPAIRTTVHDAKFARIMLSRLGLEDIPFSFDTMLAAYVLDPGGRSYEVETLADTHLHRRMQSCAEVTGKGKNRTTFAGMDIAAAARFSGERAAAVAELERIFAPRLEEGQLAPLYHELEMPLMAVLAEMEMSGVRLDTELLEEMSAELARGLSDLENRIAESAGERFNINSPKQLGYILFEKLKLKTARRGKTGYSTDIDVLTRLAASHELPALVLEYRQLSKLKSTYVDALPQMINPRTGRVHTSFNQAVTSTGRLSSSNPNLQNIPIRTELGRKIREAFIAEPGNYILSADYSQIELRIMAHISRDPVLIEAFRSGADIHTATAALIFGIFPEMLTAEHRRRAKIINFGVMYGMGAHSLSEQLGITHAEAKRYIDNYFETHSGVRAYMEKTVSEAERNGFVTTLLGRRRYLPDLHSTNRNVVEFARRTAVNTPIQGSAADLIKKSMINLSRRMKEEELKSYMILQVHDELVLEAAENEVERVTSLVKEVMEGAMTLSVPLVVEIGYGKHWLEAH